MVRRVANHRQRTAPATPNTIVAARIEVLAANVPRAGTASGTRVMSPRLLTDETRPIWLGAIVRRYAADSHTDAVPAVMPTPVIATTTPGSQPTPTSARQPPCTTSPRKPAS